MAFLRRKRKERYSPPPPPTPEMTEAVREAEVTSEIQASVVRDRDEEVNSRFERSRRMRNENALGARFWQAVGERRGT